MTDGAHVHQCPYCELKFLFANEVKGHVVADHPSHAVSYVGMTTTELERRVRRTKLPDAAQPNDLSKETAVNHRYWHHRD